MKLSFVGDIMLGRFVRDKWLNKNYSLFSEKVLQYLDGSDYVVANLESPITEIESANSLAFAGDKRLLGQCRWADCFSLSNNHINDFGQAGIKETLLSLDEADFQYNGIISSDDSYRPWLIEKDNCKIAVVMCTDMLNYEFEVNSLYCTLRFDSPLLLECITKYNGLGYFVILFAHCGSLFSRFPNPQVRDIICSTIDAGVKCVVTAHSHCLGGMFSYKEIPVFYSLGDFLMDGGSYRRRQSCILSLEIINNHLKGWNVKPTITNLSLVTELPDEKTSDKMMKSWNMVSRIMKNEVEDYGKFYSKQYKKEMLFHSLSTLKFLYDTNGIWGFLRMLKVRFRDVATMMSRMLKGRSNMRYDSDAVDTKLSNRDIA